MVVALQVVGDGEHLPQRFLFRIIDVFDFRSVASDSRHIDEQCAVAHAAPIQVTLGALIVLSLSAGAFGVIVSVVLYGIGFGSAHPVLQAMTIRLARPGRKGVANASLATATDLGIGLGAIMLGWVSQLTDVDSDYTCCAAFFRFTSLTKGCSTWILIIMDGEECGSFLYSVDGEEATQNAFDIFDAEGECGRYGFGAANSNMSRMSRCHWETILLSLLDFTQWNKL